MKDGTQSGSGGRCAEAALAAAYLDGELGVGAAAQFERHSRACADCSDALREQRRLLCMLEAAFDETFSKGSAPALPDNFAREVSARALSDMSGVRAPCERRRALKICAALSAAALVLTGFGALDAALAPVWDAARAAGALAGLAGRAAADAGTGAGLVMRAAGGRFVTGHALLLVLQLAALACALLLLLWLISGYRRARASD